MKYVNIGCCGCHTGEAQLALQMPKTGFCVAHDRIPVTFVCIHACRNGSPVQTTAKVEVVQSIVYKANGYHKYSNKIIDYFSCQIQPSESYTKVVEFDLPPSIILGFTTEIITVSHSVNLLITTSFMIVKCQLEHLQPFSSTCDW